VRAAAPPSRPALTPSSPPRPSQDALPSSGRGLAAPDPAAATKASPAKRPPPAKALPGASPPKKATPEKKKKETRAAAGGGARRALAVEPVDAAEAADAAPSAAPKAKPRKRAPAKPKKKADAGEAGEAAAVARPARAARAVRRYLTSHAPLGPAGPVYRPGTFAYVALDESEADTDAGSASESEEGDACAACGAGHKPAARGAAADPDGGVPMLECSACLAGFHLDCLDPPLSEVPAAEWLCPACEGGGGGAAPAPTTSSSLSKTLRQRFAAGAIGLVRIDALWSDPSSSAGASFSGPWVVRPEETHTGRAKGHGAREVFLSAHADANDAACLLAPAAVVREADLDSTPGDDVFYCRYEYSPAAAAFRPLGGSVAARSDGAAAPDPATAPVGDAAAADASDGDDDGASGAGRRRGGKEDREYRPAQDTVLNLWRRRGLAVPGAAAARKQPSRAKRQGGGGDAVADKLGAGVEVEAAAPAPTAPSTAPRPARLPTPDADVASLPLLPRARAALAPSASHCGLPGRDAERARLDAFIRGAAADGASTAERCLYVYGVPGTGKTAAVLDAVKRASEAAAAGDGRPFRFVEINALRLPSPRHAYTRLHAALHGEAASPAVAHDALNARIGAATAASIKPGSPADVATIVLVDELDLLVTRSQQVLYNLFEWPTRARSGLAVIGVANTMDLPDRLLPRIASRFAAYRLPFAPYGADALAAIVGARLDAARARGAFDPRAVQYAARKVAAMAGDVRRVLEVCRVAAENAGGAGAAAVGDAHAAPLASTAAGPVTMEHVDAAVRALFGAPHVRALASAPAGDLILLAALALEARLSGRAAATLATVAPRAADLAASAGLPQPTLGDCAAAAARLGASRVLIADGADRRAAARLQLDVPLEDVIAVLKRMAGGRLGFLAGLRYQ
jgi:origin recognition complex subunit 1